MNVAFTMHPISLRAAGLRESARGLAMALGGQGDQVTVYGSASRPLTTEESDWGPARLVIHSTWGPHSFGLSPEIPREMADADHQLVHVHGLWTYASLAASAWHRYAHRPYIVHPHGMLDPLALRIAASRKRMALVVYQRRILQRAACIRALSDVEADDIMRLRLGVPVCVVANAVEVSAPGDDGPPWADEGIREHVLLYLGRLHPIKNLVQLLIAWAQIGREAKNWTLVIAGWAEQGHDEILRKTAADLPYGSVVFIGPLFGKDKGAAYAHADALVLPSLSEAFPIVALEAWAHAKPVVMTPQSNIPEGFETDSAIRIGTEARAMIPALRRLFSMSDEERREMGQRGLDLVRLRFSLQTIGGQMKSVDRWVLGGGPSPDVVRTGSHEPIR
jgi:glycosyltransferase involved in cell wall biosynthesis